MNDIDDPDNLPAEHLIARYVIECRGQGHFLPYIDHQVIEEWLALAPSKEDLLLILSDILPDYFAKSQPGAPPRSLKGARKLVLTCLREKTFREAERNP